MIRISTDDPNICRDLRQNANFQPVELFPASADGHKFKPGDRCRLVGMTQFPEYNGQIVQITAIREDGPHGKAYYIDGDLILNWVYEYRLELVNEVDTFDA